MSANKEERCCLCFEDFNVDLLNKNSDCQCNIFYCIECWGSVKICPYCKNRISDVSSFYDPIMKYLTDCLYGVIQ